MGGDFYGMWYWVCWNYGSFLLFLFGRVLPGGAADGCGIRWCIVNSAFVNHDYVPQFSPTRPKRDKILRYRRKTSRVGQKDSRLFTED